MTDDGATERELVAHTLERYQASTRRMQTTETTIFMDSTEKAKASDTNYRPLILQIESIIRSMPASKTDAFFEAQRVIPHLVATETDPVKYLRRFDRNPEAAAKHIVWYWDMRRETFGERWFRPMISTSDGILTERDREHMRTGLLVVLPNDSHGRTVLCWDTSRRLEHDPVVRQRIIFYAMQVASENELSQTEGLICICVFLDEQKYDEYSNETTFATMAALAVKIHCCHLVDLAPSKNSVTKFEQTFESVLHEFPTPIHRYPRKRDYVSALAAFGLSRQGLPRCVGGLWSYRWFVAWQNERTKIERKRYLEPAVKMDDTGAPVYFASNEEDATDEEEDEETGDILQDHRRLLEEAMHQIPDTEKDAYLAALEYAPDEIRENEANIDWFLLVEELNCWLAAQRLARYWNLRAETFKEKCYSALNQTGEGALGKVDIHKALCTGFVTLLPMDSYGCPVIWIDGTKLHQASGTRDSASLRRCLFYMFSILAENEESQKDGAVLIWMLRQGYPFQDIDVHFLERLSECLPVHFKAVHLLSQDNGLLREDLSPRIRFGDDVYHHIAVTKAELASMLQRHGLKLSNLPKTLGGQWGVGQFCEWMELRTRFEWKLPLGLSGRSEVAEAFRFPNITPYGSLSAEEKAVRTRRMNVIHSRRKRDRIKVESEVLQEHVDDLRGEKRRLVMENRRLESLMAATQKVLSPSSAPLNIWSSLSNKLS